jgi:hypothetical protein
LDVSAYDPLQRRLEREAEELEAAPPPPLLNPPWPYKAEPFDALFFALDQVPEKQADP